MPTCTHCGVFNPDGTTHCIKCGVALGPQLRAKQDESRARTGTAVRVVAWLAAIVVLVLIGPSLYHTGYGKYLKFHLDSVSVNTIQSCGGPVTDSTPSYQRDEITKCIATNDDLNKAQEMWDKFNKTK